MLRLKWAPARTKATRWGALTARRASGLGGLNQFEGHREDGGVGGGLGELAAVSDSGEGGLDRVGRAQVLPVPGGIVVECQQLGDIAGDLGTALGNFAA